MPEEPPFEPGEADALAQALQAALPCRAVVVRARTISEADWVYLVATLGEGSWVEVRERGGAPPEHAEETCLRVGLSAFGRYATLQEATLSGAVEVGGRWVEERRRPGVEDRRLQDFVKASQGVLRREGVVTLDAAFLLEREALPGAPTRWSLLFERDPADTTVGDFLPADG